jgi:alkanesulfonate monooxygenase SsuD/methylene tetrahydromethanopterin reductase-like flavin-dependent oxidoreductase (luciferase family)
MTMHLLASLAAHGWHSAAWRVTGAAGFAGAAPFQAMAQTAERGGLDAVLVGMPTAPRVRRDSGKIDGIRLDPLPLLGAMIGATERVGLCAWWPGDVAEPFHVARVFATLDHLASGRTGWITGLEGPEELGTRFRRTNLPATEEDSAARLVELVDVARQLWDSWEDRGFVVDQASGTFADPAHVHPIDHAGRFFTVRGPLNVPRPLQGQPVILHRDVPAGPMRSGAAASAEVVLAECATVAEAAASRKDWRALAQKHGRDPDALRFIVRVMPILAESEQAAQKRAAELDGLAGVDGQGTSVPRIVGTPEQFADWLAQWHGAGACDGFDILPAVLPVDLDLLVEAVVPQLRRRGLRPAGYEHPTLRGHLGLRRAPSRYAA